MLGDRSLEPFKAFVLPELSGVVVVHDRCQNYDSKQLAAPVHQLCCAHLQRDLADLAESYPDQRWPTLIAEAITGLVHQANLARAAGREAIDPQVKPTCSPSTATA